MKPKDKQEFLRLYDVHKTYRVISEVGSGTYGRVYKAISAKSNKYVALKKIDMSRQELDGFPITAIREIKLLRMLNHKNIIALLEIIMSRPSNSNKSRGSTYLVFEYMDHDFVGLMTIKYRFKLGEIKCIMRQMLEGLKYLHEKRIIHRDMKSANILLNNNGEVKIADFGLARQISNAPNVYYTNKVVTLWYRAPELLLGSTDYSTEIDIWSLGCIFAELLTGEILFKGDKEARQLEIIYEICGSPDKTNWPDVDKLEYFTSLGPKIPYERKLKEVIKGKRSDLDYETIDFLECLLVLDPKKRATAETALNHPFFISEPFECSLRDMPRIEKECHETLLRAKKTKKEEFINKGNENNNEKIGLGNEKQSSPNPEQQKFHLNYKDFKEKPGGYRRGFDDGHNNMKHFYPNSRGGFKGGPHMRGGNPFYKRGLNNEGGFIGKNFSNNNPNPIIAGQHMPNSGFRGGFSGGPGYRKFSNMSNNDLGNSNTTNNNNNNNANTNVVFTGSILNDNIKKAMNLNPTSQETENKEQEQTNIQNKEEITPFEKKQPENELREMLIAHLPSGGLRSLIQNTVTSVPAPNKDEEKEYVLQVEIVEKPQETKKIVDPIILHEINMENPSEVIQMQTQIPIDKTIFAERRIKRKDPNPNISNAGENPSKKIHME